jgi:DNA mismatch endonuclease (patch repair protein)
VRLAEREGAMPDVFAKAKRSVVMSRIRGSGNKDTDLRLITLMRATGVVGWRRGVRLRFAATNQRPAIRDRELTSPSSVNWRGLTLSARAARRQAAALQVIVRPDFVFPKQRLAVFVDGCFFHGCPKHATWPKNNAAFWRAKITGNMARDRLQTRLLRAHGWRVIRIWECQLVPRRAARTITRLWRACQGGG